jgi:hypothetical protein
MKVLPLPETKHIGNKINISWRKDGHREGQEGGGIR